MLNQPLRLKQKCSVSSDTKKTNTNDIKLLNHLLLNFSYLNEHKFIFNTIK